MHPETMLLVDHHQAEIAELDRLLEQRVRADQDVDASRFQLGKNGLALAATLASREQRDAQAGRRRERADRLEVLAREKLGRRHQRALRAGLDRAGKSEQSHHRLAAADIALQQAEHAVRAGKVGVDLPERAGLRACELEGKGSDNRLAQSSRGGKPPAGSLLHALADHGERKLIGEQLIVGKAHPCGSRRRRDRPRPSAHAGDEAHRGKTASRFARRNASSIHSGSDGSRVSASPIALRSTELERPAVKG